MRRAVPPECCFCIRLHLEPFIFLLRALLCALLCAVPGQPPDARRLLQQEQAAEDHFRAGKDNVAENVHVESVRRGSYYG